MKARKRFGQHFLKDHFVLQQFKAIVNPKPEDHLVEIGPGHGAFTEYLIDLTKQFDLIEIDRDLAPILEKKYPSQVYIHQADVLNFDLHQLTNQKQSLRLVGNLPYNISTPLLFHLFKQIALIQDMHFLLQQEVAQRIVAQPGERQYGRLSVMTQFYCQVELLMTVPPEAFSPPPKVMSGFIRLVPRKEPLTVKSLPQFQAIVREAFNYRRKSIHNSLKKWMTADQIEQLGMSSTSRPQEISIEDYIRISNALSSKTKV